MKTKLAMMTASFPTESVLYLAYMPFVSGGGLFIKTTEQYSIGDKLLLEVQLLSDPTPHEVHVKVVWITPQDAQGNRPAGVGVQFSGSNARFLRQKIEAYLSGMLQSSQLTDTL